MRKNTTNYRGRFEILSGITTLQKSIQGAFTMSKSTSFLYQLARAANDIEKLASGDPKRIARRAKNKYIGKKLIRKAWKFPF